MIVQIFIATVLLSIIIVIFGYSQYKKGRGDMLNYLFNNKHIDAELYRKIQLKEKGKKDEYR